MDMIERGRSSFAYGSILEQRRSFMRRLFLNSPGEELRSSSDVAREAIYYLWALLQS